MECQTDRVILHKTSYAPSVPQLQSVWEESLVKFQKNTKNNNQKNSIKPRFWSLVLQRKESIQASREAEQQTHHPSDLSREDREIDGGSQRVKRRRREEASTSSPRCSGLCRRRSQSPLVHVCSPKAVESVELNVSLSSVGGWVFGQAGRWRPLVLWWRRRACLSTAEPARCQAA